MTHISGELALSIIRNAFAPLHCGAEIYDGNRARFNLVDDAGTSIARVDNIESDEFMDTERLGWLLVRVREDVIAHQGVELQPWSMPAVQLLG